MRTRPHPSLLPRSSVPHIAGAGSPLPPSPAPDMADAGSPLPPDPVPHP